MAVIPGKNGRKNTYSFTVTPDLEQRMEKIAMEIEGNPAPSAALQRSVMELGAAQKLLELNQSRLGKAEAEIAEVRNEVAQVKAGVMQILELLKGD